MDIKMPLEGLVTTAIEQISTGVQLKVSQIEEQKSRDFLYQMKELEFYKSNYEKDIKVIFDYWFDVIRVLHIKDNKAITQQQRDKYNKEHLTLTSVDKMARMQMNTLKYGGKETARILAMTRIADDSKTEQESKNITLFVWTTVLAVLKKDVLGQDLDTLDILRVLLNDFEKYEDAILSSKEYAVNVYKKRYGENPYWK